MTLRLAASPAAAVRSHTVAPSWSTMLIFVDAPASGESAERMNWNTRASEARSACRPSVELVSRVFVLFQRVRSLIRAGKVAHWQEFDQALGKF
jgi:hypothetical protein